MINPELPDHMQNLAGMIRQLATDGLRPISRKYDLLESPEVPEELVAIGGMLKGAQQARKSDKAKADTAQPRENRNGANLSAITFVEEFCWGDVALFLALPTIGLGNAAVEAVATEEQKREWGELFASMAITEPGTGSDSAAIKTTARLDGDEWVINGEKIFVTSGYRSKQVVVWASLDLSLGKAAIKSFLVPKGTPGMTVARVEHKLGLRASDTAQIIFDNCRIPKANILGTADIATTQEERKKAFGGVMQTFDNTRPAVAAQGLGVARAALDLTAELLREEGLELDYSKPEHELSAIEDALMDLEAEYEAARLLVQKAAWMADNRLPNSMNASMSKAKAGRMVVAVASRCVELCGQAGYSKGQLLEKFARDAKIIDIYEGTQQIQQLIVARNVLGKSSSELR